MRWNAIARRLGIAAAGALGCNGASAPPNFTADDGGPGPTTSASGDESGDSVGEPFEPESDEFWVRYAEVQAEAEQMDVDGFFATYPPHEPIDGLSYDPLAAVGLDAITQVHTLDAAQTEQLAASGFVAFDPVAPTSTFEQSYLDLYHADLPVLVTADSILYALHRSFDAFLTDVEAQALIPELDAVLASMHAELASELDGDLTPEFTIAAQDADVYLTVARSLLGGAPVAAVTGDAAAQRVERILADAQAGAVTTLELFGRAVDYDYSQFKPRGHYTDSAELTQYFGAMIWLGRTDLSLVAFDQGQPQLIRRGLEGAVLLHQLLAKGGGDLGWARIDGVLRAMIGDPDSMGPADLPNLLSDLGIADFDGLAALDDATLLETLVEKRYGIQRIMSQIMITDPADPPLLLPRVFLLLGQRFTLDSYVFNNVTYDRVQDLQTGTKVTRMLPDELDVQFVLGSNEAAALLEPELDQYGYQGLLHELRFLVDAHPQEFWDASFYAGWLSAVRALNPSAQEYAAYPEPMRTKAWRHKTLVTQSASRAELRHDTLLYAKQSYSGGIGCEYPDGYVEPVPAFYARMGQIGERGAAVVDALDLAGYSVIANGGTVAAEYFASWSGVMATLADIASRELAGETLTGEQIAFLGQVIEQETIGCGEIAYDGWYPSLFYNPATLAESRPTVADVHTAPTDAAGTPVGWVLHTATARPMLLVLTVPTCDADLARAYIGPMSDVRTVLTESFERLDDETWREMLDDGQGARPPWSASFIP